MVVAGGEDAGPVPRVLVISIDPAETAFRRRLGIVASLLAGDGMRVRLSGGADDAVVVRRRLVDPADARLLRRRDRPC